MRFFAFVSLVILNASWLFGVFVATAAANEITAAKEVLSLLNGWSEKFGLELWHFSEFVTRRKAVHEAETTNRDGADLIKEVAQKLKTLLDSKEHAVSRIMDAAANTAESESVSEVLPTYQYTSAKTMPNSFAEYASNPGGRFPDDGAVVPRSFVRKRRLVVNATATAYHRMTKRFTPPSLDAAQNPENFERSAVHVPVDVYDRDSDVIHAIKWSENLDSIFKSNLKLDPNIKLQYFGSSTGFLRFYPSSPWVQEPVDLYDCRTRLWYIEAASAPKDLVILIDNSGSMTGLRKQIARHIATSLLDTLGNNDYVNIFTFSNITVPIVPCYGNRLVQANLGNVRQLKEAMYAIETENIANLTDSLMKSFELLRGYRDDAVDGRDGGKCNQAIMLITDNIHAMPNRFFETFNSWKSSPAKPVRIFSYVIGEEVPVREFNRIACTNRGFHVHLSSLAEVRTKVLHYVQVMARPLVLWNRAPQSIWSSFYAHIIDPKLTDFLWRQFERQQQKERSFFFLEQQERGPQLDAAGHVMAPLEPPPKPDFGKQFVVQQAKKNDDFDELEMYTLVTSVSKPVYDRRKLKNYTEDVKVNEAQWIRVTRQAKAADLLGVAGIDVPLSEIEQAIAADQFGVNGYAFIVHSNGYVLMHPELRPVFNGILKPAYNRVDMTELELMDEGDEQVPREFNSRLLELRDLMINQKSGKKVLKVKQYLDKMMRVMKLRRHYHYTGIENTPFTLVVTLPEPYGLWKMQQSIDDEIHRLRANNLSPSDYFAGDRWRIHPKWVYCKYLMRRQEHSFASVERELLHFFDKMMQPGWKWSHQKGIQCNRNLIQNLVYDAKVTNWFNQNVSVTKRVDNEHISRTSPISFLMALLPRNELIKRFGIVIAFVATRSGLLRWQDFHGNDRSESHFSRIHRRATDETWYKRAVNHYYVDNTSFVYSVPFFAEGADETLVTASSAVFIGDAAQKTPIATVGYQSLHKSLYSIFINVSGNCIDRKCSRTCQSDDLACYILDDNGYVFMSERRSETGQFFGNLRPDILQQMVRDQIYERTQMFDYQAVCFDRDKSASFAFRLLNPFLMLKTAMVSLLQAIVVAVEAIRPHRLIDRHDNDVVVDVEDDDDLLIELVDDDDAARIVTKTHATKRHGAANGGHGSPAAAAAYFDQNIKISKTLPEPCDKTVYLYNAFNGRDPAAYANQFGKLWTMNCSRSYMAQRVPYSNLIMVVVRNASDSCTAELEQQPFAFADGDNTFDIWPRRVNYNMSLPCYQSNFNNYQRNQYYFCINHHENESNYEDCGRAFNAHQLSQLLFLACAFLIIFID